MPLNFKTEMFPSQKSKSDVQKIVESTTYMSSSTLKTINTIKYKKITSNGLKFNIVEHEQLRSV